MAFCKWACGLCPMGTAAFTGNYSILQVNSNKWLNNMSCEDCRVKFNFLKRKRTCLNCEMSFCGSCLKKGAQRCHRCQVLTAVPLNRNLVFDLRVKDLRWYLETNQVPTQGCKEKADLVDLVVHHAELRNAARTYPQNYERHTVRPENVKVEGPSRTSPVPLPTQDSHPANECPENTSTGSPIPNIQIREIEDDFTVVDIVDEVPSQSSTEEQKVPDPKIEEQSSFTPLSINDITNIDQISNMTVMQMKLILARNFIGFKGCCEKQELQDKVRKLWKQKQGNKDANIPDENLCKICMEAPIDSVLLDCGHLVTCTECGKRLHECPICREYVVRVVHTFKA